MQSIVTGITHPEVIETVTASINATTNLRMRCGITEPPSSGTTISADRAHFTRQMSIRCRIGRSASRKMDSRSKSNPSSHPFTIQLNASVASIGSNNKAQFNCDCLPEIQNGSHRVCCQHAQSAKTDFSRADNAVPHLLQRQYDVRHVCTPQRGSAASSRST